MNPLILHVNDDDANRYLVSRMLLRAGFRVIEAATGREAIRLGASDRPDLVVLDVRLPDISGFDVCRRLKADPRTANIPVLLTSATLTSTDKRVEGLDVGADAYLTQPVEPPELTATVRALLRTRRAEEESRAAARRWQATFDGIGDGVCLVDRNDTILHCNKALATMVGRTPAELAGRSLRLLLAESFGPLEWPALTSGGRQVYELRAGDRSLRLTADPVDDGAGTRVQTVADVTAHRRLEEELQRRNAALAEADQRKDEFLAMLAHELRNPLSAITSALYLQERSGPTDDRSVRLRAMLHRQTRHLARLVEDLLDVSRITRGKIQLRRERCDFGQIARQAMQAARPAAEAGKLELVARLPDDPLPVDADPTRLEQIAANLLGNACRYTPPNGRVELTVERVGAEARLVVRDTGIGIAPQHLACVFDLFMQVDQSLSRSHGGLGIGLTLVKNLTRMHGGSVHARSAGLGQGSEFEVRLPLLAEDALPASAARDDLRAHPTGGPLTIVLVEDNPDACEAVRSMLELWGHQVLVASDGASGAQLIVERRPDVALVDIGLDGLDGYEVARRVRSGVGREVRLIAMTGYARFEDRERALDAGFDLHLAKPVEPCDLERTIHPLTVVAPDPAAPEARTG